MSKVCELHDDAMLIMQKAHKAKHAEDIDACALFLLACEYEATSAYLVEKKEENEPSRSMLFLGAASLAWLGQDYENAERYVGEGLSGYPPEHVKEDLRKLLDDIKFSVYAEKEKLSLGVAEAALKIYGDNVGYGIVPTHLLIQRIKVIDQLVQRTTQRKNGVPFAKQAKKKVDYPEFETDIEWGEAGSFGFKIHLRQKNPIQLSLLKSTVKPQEILDDIFINLNLLNENNVNSIKENIGDDTYFENFMGYAKSFAPDGKSIHKIGLTIKNKKELQFNNTRKNIKIQPLEVENNDEKQNSLKKQKVQSEVHKGWVRFSDGLKNKITIFSEDNEKIQTLTVSEALDEIVREFFGTYVEVVCQKKGRFWHLIDITPVEQ